MHCATFSYRVLARPLPPRTLENERVWVGPTTDFPTTCKQAASFGTQSIPHQWTYQPHPPRPTWFPKGSGRKWPGISTHKKCSIPDVSKTTKKCWYFTLTWYWNQRMALINGWNSVMFVSDVLFMAICQQTIAMSVERMCPFHLYFHPPLKIRLESLDSKKISKNYSGSDHLT